MICEGYGIKAIGYMWEAMQRAVADNLQDAVIIDRKMADSIAVKHTHRLTRRAAFAAMFAPLLALLPKREQEIEYRTGKTDGSFAWNDSGHTFYKLNFHRDAFVLEYPPARSVQEIEAMMDRWKDEPLFNVVEPLA